MNKLKINARPTDDNTYNVLKLNKSTKFVMAGRIEGSGEERAAKGSP